MINTAYAVAPTTVMEEHRDILVSEALQETTTPPDMSKPATLHFDIETAKPKKNLLPSTLIGSKPGAIPNTKFLAVESKVRRKLATASTVVLRKGLPPDLGTFEVYPSKIQFGTIGSERDAKFSLRIRNVGIDSSRFRVQLPKESLFITSYKAGPVTLL